VPLAKNQESFFCSFCLDTPHKAGVNFTNQKIKTIKKYIEILCFISLKLFELSASSPVGESPPAGG
jgi:hypothetical protein